MIPSLLDCASQMCNVNLVSKGGNITKTHALLLASASEIMKTVVLDAINSDEVVVIILPDFTKEEVQQGLEEITKRVLKLKLDESSFLATLGIGIPPFRKSSKDMKSETLCENEEDIDIDIDFHEDLQMKDEQMIGDMETFPVVKEPDLKSEIIKFDQKTEEEPSINYEEMYQCNFCADRFENEAAFSKHMRRNHEDKTDYYGHIEEVDGKWFCKVCRKINPRKIGCIQHWRKVHNKLKSKLKCDVCNKDLSNKYNLKLHMKMHTGKRDYICDTCGIGFFDKKQLDKHHVRLHGSAQEKESKKTHVCSTCGKGFWNKTTLTNHEDVHLEGNNFFCDQCECTFKTSNALRIHTNRIHLKKWQYTEEQREKQNLRKRKFRADKKAKNGGMLRTPEEKVVFNEYMRNYMARRKAAAKDAVVRQLNM